MEPETPRWALLFGALAGASVWGLHTLVVAWQAGRFVSRGDWLKAGVNVVCGILAGCAAAWFTGGVLMSYLPRPLQEPYAVGFVMGCLAWEALPFGLRLFKARAEKAVAAESKTENG